MKMLFVFCLYFQYPFAAQIYVGDSATVFISRNSSVHIEIDAQDGFFIADGGKVKTISDDRSYQRNSKRQTSKSRFVVSRWKKVRPAEIPIEKVQKPHDNSIVYKPQDNSTYFTLNNSNRQSFVVPSPNVSVFGIIPKQASINFGFHKDLKFILNSENIKISEYGFSYSIRPPPLFV